MASKKTGSGFFRRAKPAPYNQRRSITASAQRLQLGNRAEMQELANQAVRMAWQEIAWRQFDRIGEIKTSYTTVAALLSKMRLYPAVIIDPTAPPVPITDGVTIERPESENEDIQALQKPNDGLSPERGRELRDLYNREFAKTNFPTALRNFSLNVNVPGECYLFKQKDQWKVKSTTELRVDSGGPKLVRSAGSLPQELPPDAKIGRIWREHPKYSFEPDSAMRAMADDCEELLLLSRVIRSNSRARLNAGILFVPDEVSAASQTQTDDEEIQEDEEAAFEATLYETLSGPVTNEDNPNTVVPMLLRGPGELGDKIVHISLDRKTDEFLVARAEKVLDRILNGMEAPKETATGHSGTKYANAVQIDENLYKAYIEPMAIVFCDALVDIVLHPLLKEVGWPEDEIAKATIWYDPSDIVTRPDRANDAQSLYDRKELSGRGLRKAYGFSEAEAPTEEELAARMVRDSPVPPEVMQILLAKVLPTILGKNLAASQAGASDLPDSLNSILQGTETPGAPGPDELGSSVNPDPPMADGGTPIASDSSAPAEQFGRENAPVPA